MLRPSWQGFGPWLERTECNVAKEPKAAGTAPDTGAPAKPAATKRKKEVKKKRERRVIPHGVVYIAATFNNTPITITDTDARVVSWSSAGRVSAVAAAHGHAPTPR